LNDQVARKILRLDLTTLLLPEAVERRLVVPEPPIKKRRSCESASCLAVIGESPKFEVV
jgi:hypothetical protein